MSATAPPPGAWRDLAWFEVAVYRHPPVWDDGQAARTPYPEVAHFATAAGAERERDRLVAAGFPSVHVRRVVVEVLRGPGP